MSLRTENDPDLDKIWQLEIERRVAELDSRAVEIVPWKVVKEKLLERLGRSVRQGLQDLQD